MVRRFYDLPSLTALAAFEAVARHRSMTRAAAELNVTTGAISRQVKSLESFVGGPLLRRERRGVEVSAKGAELYAVLSTAFSQFSHTLRQIKSTATTAAVTVGAPTAFASLWLMKRIGDFWRAHPDITINHLVSDNAHDLRRAEIDLRIRYGNGSWPDESVAFDVSYALVRGGILPEPLYRLAVATFGQHGTNELIYLVGLYSLVSTTLNGFNVPVPERE